MEKHGLNSIIYNGIRIRGPSVLMVQNRTGSLCDQPNSLLVCVRHVWWIGTYSVTLSS
jgi:hypothetical protein